MRYRPPLGPLLPWLLFAALVALAMATPRSASSESLTEPALSLKRLEAQLMFGRARLHGAAARLAPPSEDARDRVAQGASARAGTPTNVLVNDPSLDDPNQGDGQSEPSLAAWGPYVLAAWIDGRGQHDPAFPGYIGYAYSTDGGQTFVQGGVPPSPPGGGMWTSDPVIAVNENTGEFYFCALFDATDLDHGVAVARATFAGTTLTWATPHVVRSLPGPIGEVDIDKPWISADALTGNVYASYTRYYGAVDDSILFTRSTDHGVTWSPSITLSSPPASGYVQGSRPAVGPSGEVYVTWKEIGQTDIQDFMRIRKSTNFGVSFGPERTAAAFIDNFGTGAPGFNREQGVTLPSIAIDRTTGPGRGRVYVAWNECVNFYDSAPDTTPKLSEQEPKNDDDPGSAQPFTPGDAIVGSFGNVNDFDYYRFDAVQGTTYIFWSDRIPTQYTLRVLCTDGVTRLAFSGDRFHNPPNQGFIVWTCPSTGAYYLRIVIVGTTLGSYRIRTGIDVPGGPYQRARDQRDVFVATSADGTTWSTPVLVHPDEPPLYDDWLPEVAVAGYGTLHVLWYDWADAAPTSCGGQSSTYLSRSDDGGGTWSAGAAVSDARTDWTNTNSNIIPNQGDYITLFANTQTVYPCWTDGRLGTPDIRTAPFPLDMVTPALVQRFTAEPMTDGMRMSWVIERPELLGGVRLERAMAEPGPWLAVEENVTSDGDAATVVDHTVEPGRTYWYRLSATTAGGEPVTFGPIRATAITSTAFALTGLAPNPTRGALGVDFVVTAQAPVSLVLFDLQGREAASLVAGVYPPGRHHLDWNAVTQGGAVPGGLYFLRVTAGVQSITQRVAIAH